MARLLLRVDTTGNPEVILAGVESLAGPGVV